MLGSFHLWREDPYYSCASWYHVFFGVDLFDTTEPLLFPQQTLDWHFLWFFLGKHSSMVKFIKKSIINAAIKCNDFYASYDNCLKFMIDSLNMAIFQIITSLSYLVSDIPKLSKADETGTLFSFLRSENSISRTSRCPCI